jgi:HK97 family phage portal protein
MGLKDIVLRYLGQQPPRSDFEDNVPIGQPVSGSVQSYVQSYSYTGEVITPARALEAPSVFACVRLIASSISRLDWSVLRETSDGKVLEPEHPLYNLLNYEPNEDMTAMAFREVMLTNALLTGNSYAYIHRNAAGQPVALEPIRSDFVAMYRDGQNQPYYQVWSGKYTGTDAEKTAKRFRGYDIFHLVGPTMEGILGVPPIHLMRDLIGLELEVSEFVTRFFANGAVPSGTLKMPGRLSPEAAKRLREAWQAAHGGASRAGRVAVLEDGLEYHPITSSFKDNDLIAIRRYCRQQIAAMFQVPAHKIGDTDTGSYNSTEQADAEFVKHTLASWATRLEQEASRKLIQRGEPYCTRVDFDSLLRADMSTRFAAYAVGITNGVLTVNEARAREGLKAVDGGDDIRVPLNTEAAAGAGMPPAAAQPVPASEDLEAEEVEPSVDMEPEEVEQQTERARDLLAAAQRTAAIAAVRPAIEAAYRRHLTRVSEYLLKQRTQAKLDKWEPPLECLDADLRDTVAGLGRLLGDEAKATKVLDESLLRHVRAMRRSVTGIANLTDTIDGWKTLPGAAAAELLDLVKCEVLNLPYLENTNGQA